MSHPDHKKKMLLWFGVTIVTLFIMGLWFLNMRTLVYDVTNKGSAEGDIYRSMEQEMSQIFSSFSIQDSLSNITITTTPAQPTNTVEADIKKSLSAIAARAATTTATTAVSSSAR